MSKMTLGWELIVELHLKVQTGIKLHLPVKMPTELAWRDHVAIIPSLSQSTSSITCILYSFPPPSSPPTIPQSPLPIGGVVPLSERYTIAFDSDDDKCKISF